MYVYLCTTEKELDLILVKLTICDTFCIFSIPNCEFFFPCQGSNLRLLLMLAKCSTHFIPYFCFLKNYVAVFLKVIAT